MNSYDILNEFLITFIYNKTEFDAIVKKIAYKTYKEYQVYRIEYTNNHDSSKGIIPYLIFDVEKAIWIDYDFPDKELCKTIGHRIEGYYYGKNVLKLY